MNVCLGEIERCHWVKPRREVDMLARLPKLTRQQISNPPQWADPFLLNSLTAGRDGRRRPGARPWIHRCSRLPEAEALARIETDLRAADVDGPIWFRARSRELAATPAPVGCQIVRLASATPTAKPGSSIRENER